VGPVLEAVGLSKAFGGVRAVEDASAAVRPGEVVGIVGANGAGKTTFVNIITGYLEPDRGRVRFEGRDITGRPPREVTGLGICRSFQVPQLYVELSVEQNALVALAARDGAGLRLWRPLATPERRDEALALLASFGLADAAARPVSELPEGALKVLDIALSVALAPRVLLLDEPTSGVSSSEKLPLMDSVLRILRERGVTVLFVEHDMEVVGRYAERVLAFVEGRIVADGPPATVLADPAVRRGVLGELV
jgi:branched-chain amino acid transport system ATP-binding protein